MDYAVETIGLTKTFSDWWGRRKVYAVDNLSLAIKTNEVYGLLGPNGSGKTTTLKMLLGLLHPTKGKALLLGGDGADPKVNARIGFLPEESYLYKYLNPRETLDFYGQLFGLPRRVRKERTETLLDMVGLKAVANRQVGAFSKGMARRIGLAQALINDPDLLILDEPTTGLDPIGTRQIKDLIIHLAQRGKTILLCSHLLADVEDVCDRIAILYGGKIQSQGQVRDLLQQADKRQITTGQLSDQAVEKIQAIIAKEQSDCEVSSPMERLETFFVRTVAQAQQESRPTSGAVSTTQIGDFLSSDGGKEPDVLAGLVQGDAKQPVKPVETSTEKVASQTPKRPAQDTTVLDQLTQPSGPTDVDVPTQAVTPKEATPPKAVQDDILQQLVDPSKQVDGVTKPTRPNTTDPSQKGDQGDA